MNPRSMTTLSRQSLRRWVLGVCAGPLLCATVHAADGAPPSPPTDSDEAGSEQNRQAQELVSGQIYEKPGDTRSAPEPAPEEGDKAVPRSELTPSTSARPVPYDASRFAHDPAYPTGYDAAAQQKVYGGKKKVENSPRPAIEWGYPQYDAGMLPDSKDWFGKKNLARPQFMVFGDWRSAVADNNNTGRNEIGQVATRLNLDFDFALTGTERIHWSMRPLDKGGRFTRYEFSGNKRSSKVELNGNFNTAFFEGDLGAITAGLTDNYQGWDLPVAIGLTPLFVQNGVWLNDAVSGAAFTIPARNSPMLNISNMDITFFAASSLLTTAALRNPDGSLADHAGQITGVTMFADVLSGYLEAGYGYTRDMRHHAGGDFSYHNLTAAFTRRYLGLISNSVRVIVNFGQSPPPGAPKTADGYLILLENSFVTAHELTLVPYANFWYGVHHPQSLARAADAGGVLVNTGINFETDGLTGFPNLDGTAQNTFGGALGLEYLFHLDQQIVVEIADVTPHNDEDGAKRPAAGNQLGFGLRYQLPITKAWILRADTMYGLRDGAKDISGIRLEIRRKF